MKDLFLNLNQWGFLILYWNLLNFLGKQVSESCLNSQTSEWLPAKIGVPQGSISDPLFFLIYINDPSNDIMTTVKFFANDTSLFSIVHDAKASAYKLKKDLQKISEWAYQLKMSFNLDLNRQAQEVIFSRKTAKSSHSLIYFNIAPVSRVNFEFKKGPSNQPRSLRYIRLL